MTYGNVSAPHLAARTLKDLATDEGREFPVASKVMINDFYVEDVIKGANSTQNLKHYGMSLSTLQIVMDFISENGRHVIQIYCQT